MSLFEKIFNRVLSEDNVAGGADSAFGSEAGNHYGNNTEGDARNIFGGVYPLAPKPKKKRKRKTTRKKNRKKKTKKKKSKKMHEIGPPSQPAALTRRFPELLFGPTHNKSSIGLAENAIKTKSKR
jgi:hypothetical protein